jgi:hypothetical protein
MYFKEKVMEINRNNYETFFLLYLDRELNPSEISEVDTFLSENADLQKEFSLLRQTIMIPGEAIFDHKELLFREEEKRRVVPFYRTRIAAAVAALILGGWLLTTQLAKKQTNGIAGSSGEKKAATVNADISVQKIKDANNHDPIVSETTVNNTRSAVQQNKKSTKNQSTVNTGITKRSKTNDLPEDNHQAMTSTSGNPDSQNPSSAESLGESDLVMQKSNVQEIQPAEIHKDIDPNQISAVADGHATAVLIASTGTQESVKYQHALLNENEYQTDNAISVISLNDKNKSITGFFKKLTRQTATDANANARKVRVSVFQFSY